MGPVEIARLHAEVEGRGDLAATLATLEDEPVYELQPAGLVFRGMDLVRRYYEHFFADFRPLMLGATLRNEWVSDAGLGMEYTLWTSTGPGGAPERHEIIAILVFGEAKLAGERLYASDRLFRMMIGPVFDEAVPVGGAPPSRDP